MAEITAAAVKELRERTGAGMMDCKKALAETNGELEPAVDWLRAKGLAAAAKKAGRTAAEGLVGVAVESTRGAVVEVNSETDFVAKDTNFTTFADNVAQAALRSGAADVEALKSVAIEGTSVDEIRQTLVAKVGENVQIRRLARNDSGNNVGAYVHGGRIGVLLELKGGSAELARGL
ncbi:MAG: translation elongation factor Ts, partial [Sphingomicrobium sp.]